jgi:hypothetical protein
LLIAKHALILVSILAISCRWKRFRRLSFRSATTDQMQPLGAGRHPTGKVRSGAKPVERCVPGEGRLRVEIGNPMMQQGTTALSE